MTIFYGLWRGSFDQLTIHACSQKHKHTHFKKGQLNLRHIYMYIYLNFLYILKFLASIDKRFSLFFWNIFNTYHPLFLLLLHLQLSIWPFHARNQIVCISTVVKQLTTGGSSTTPAPSQTCNRVVDFEGACTHICVCGDGVVVHVCRGDLKFKVCWQVT